MERVILHVDANSFYASVECLYTPAIREKPVAVCGSADDRHGIVLAKNLPAKRQGVQTGEAIWQARERCPELVVVPPDYELYQHFSRKLCALYAGYTDRVEAFGLDECWLDISAPHLDMLGGAALAHQIRRRVKRELGLTVSVGVSDNKVFAKLGSDYKKPDAVTTIWRENYRQVAWPLPVGALLYVGPRTAKKLAQVGVYTIGQLAQMECTAVERLLGKNGVMIQAFAMGLDRSAVRPMEAEEPIQSVGNSTTPPHDIRSPEDAKCILYLLAESVGERLRRLGFQARVVSVAARTTQLAASSCRRTQREPTGLTGEIARAAFELFCARQAGLLPLRSLGLSCSGLVPEGAPVQLDLLGRQQGRQRAEALDRALDSLRYRFGHRVVRRGLVLADGQFARVDPSAQVIHPVGFLRGEGGVSYGRP